jgi:hypothetical protein
MKTNNPDRDRYFKRFWDSECVDPTPPPYELDELLGVEYDLGVDYEVDYNDDLYREWHDMVNEPEHYASGNIECIDAMEACASTEEFRGHLKLTAFKYVWRTGKKWNTTEDIDKAIWYLTRLKETYNG